MECDANEQALHESGSGEMEEAPRHRDRPLVGGLIHDERRLTDEYEVARTSCAGVIPTTWGGYGR